MYCLLSSSRCTTDRVAHILPSLDQKCSPKGCWYCRDLCHHCMQPSCTLYSGVHQDDILLKFCSEACQLFWFPAVDHSPLHAASVLESHQPQKSAPTITVIFKHKDRVEQIYLSTGEVSDDNNLNMPYIVWHIRELKLQYFTHFYISKDCLPLKPVWIKHFCTRESEAITDLIANDRSEIQSHIQLYLNQAVQMCGVGDLKSFLSQADYNIALKFGKYACV